MSQLMELWDEFNLLKNDLFGKDMFVVMNDNDDKTKRYNQLLGFFYPQFRTSGWERPM